MHQGDTSSEAARVQLATLRNMTGEQRLRMAFRLTDFMRRAALSRIRSEHPEWSEWQVKRELLRIAFYPAPLPEGLP